MMPWLQERWDQAWFGTPVLQARLTTLRVVFFGVLAFDQWVLFLPKAVRYGAGDFNVSHVAALDGLLPVPGAELVGVFRLVGGALALMATRDPPAAAYCSMRSRKLSPLLSLRKASLRNSR